MGDQEDAAVAADDQQPNTDVAADTPTDDHQENVPQQETANEDDDQQLQQQPGDDDQDNNNNDQQQEEEEEENVEQEPQQEQVEEEENVEQTASVSRTPGKDLFPAEIPDGVVPMMISIKNMEKYELKTGEALKDTVDFKWFEKAWVLDEIQNLGFYSDFNDFKKEIGEYPEEQILVVADHDEVYGQNWMICLSKAAADLMFGIIDAERARMEEEQRIRDEEEARRLAEEEAERNKVYEDKPIIPQPRESYTDFETKEDIEWLDVKPTRKLMRMTISRKRSEFGAPVKFSDRDSEQSGLYEFRQHKDPNFELKRKVLDSGLQACPSWTASWLPHSCWKTTMNGEGQQRPQDDDDIFATTPATAGTGGKKNMSNGVFEYCAENLQEEDAYLAREIPRMVDGASQTPFFRQLNRATQYEFVELTEEEKEALEERQVGRFLNDVMPVVEFALQQNETFNMFANEFMNLQTEEVTGLGNKEDNFLRELRTFTDLVYSNGKVLSAVDWHPRSQNVVAVACTEPLKFDQRVEHSGKEKNAFILIWNFADLIHPQLVLQSPHECTQFSFNPDNPNLIAGGCVTGQVILWDISKAQEQLKDRKEDNNNATKKVDNTENGGDGSNISNSTNSGETQSSSSSSSPSSSNKNGSTTNATIPPVLPAYISTIDQSHKRPVSHLEWISGELHVNSLGKVESLGQPMNKESHQFVTCAGDGRLMFWDSRFSSSANKRVKQQAATDNEDGEGGSSGGLDEIHWTPIFKCALFRNEGTGEYGLSRIALKGRLDIIYNHLLQQSANNNNKANHMAKNRAFLSGTMFTCATEEGELIYGDWQGAGALKSARRGSNVGINNNPEDQQQQKSADEKIIWVARDHFRSCLALKRSPFFPFLLLSVSPNGFNVWKEDLDRPLFSSPIATGMSHLTCAEWSPTRPAVIMVGKSDGTVDVWDLMDQSHRPSATVPVAAYAITSIQFRAEPPSAKKRNNNKSQKMFTGGSVDSKDFRTAIVAERCSKAPTGDQVQLLALGDATGNLHILEIPRNLRWRMPTEEKLMVAFFERELERVAYVMERNVIREREREGLLTSFEGPATGLIASNSDESELDRDSKEYKKLVEAEEKRYQALSAKLLSENFASSSSNNNNKK